MTKPGSYYVYSDIEKKKWRKRLKPPLSTTREYAIERQRAAPLSIRHMRPPTTSDNVETRSLCMSSGADQHEKSHSCSRGHRRTEQKRVSPRRRTLVIRKPLILSIAHIRVFIRI